MAGLDQIKRQARKEAWYSDSYNPFRKTTRSNTWQGNPTPGNDDPEQGLRGAPEGSLPLSKLATEPIPESPQFANDEEHQQEVRSESKPEDYEMTKPEGANGRPSDPESETTVVERQSTRPRSEEEKARHRFLGNFRKEKQEPTDLGEEEKPKHKKQPWYKGKEVPHKPFTVRNQLQRTIFNSWINVLLIAAPVGIGLNYAGVDGKVVFCVNFIAIIPLAAMLSFATEELALHVGESLGGLLNASFG
jgi:Ca2+:H+ antiporter